MELSKGKEAALVSWMNSVCPHEPVRKIIHMKDGHQLLRFTYKVVMSRQGKVSCETLLETPFSETMEVIINILQDDFNFSRRQSSFISQKISQEIDLELQLAKVVLVLCYCGFKENNLVPDLDVKTELMIASMFRFIKDDADGLSLHEGLDKFLTKDSVLNLSSSSESSIDSPFYTGEESGFFGPRRVQFQRLLTVACTSVSSPVQDTISTPHLQLERLRKELAREGDVRYELEKELANQISIISEKEGVISQLQHRVDRLLQKTGEMETYHNARVLELQEKNDSLLKRVHEVVKQCQDFKTSSTQKEKKIDELMEENTTLASKVRNAFAQLARGEEEIAKLTLAHEMSQSIWKDKREFLEKELNEAITHREVMSEHIQILQGKVSVLEDELQKAQCQESGEVLGPSLEALTKIESLQTQTLELTEQISLKDDENTHLRKECDCLDYELKLVRQQKVEINETIKDHEDTIKKLQQELCCAASTASKKQEEMLLLSAEITCLKEKINHYNENNLQKQQEFSVLEAEHKVLKENMTSLQNQLAEATVITGQKASELLLLQQELCHQKTLRKTSLELETFKCEEFKRKVSEFQAKLLEVSSLASERESHVSSLQDEMKRQERHQAKLQLKVEKQSDSILALKNIARKLEQQCKELLEKLRMTSQKLQQYSENKQELTEAREMNKSLENSLETCRREIKALETELTLARMELDQERAKVKGLTQVNFSNRRLQKKKMSDDIHLLRVPQTWQDTSGDSSESEINADGHWVASGENRTPQTPGSVEAEESFYTLHPTRYQHNLTAQRYKPVSTNTFKKNDATATSSKTNEQENNPENSTDDWMRIAELQARNKSCLPHLKSSYPLESRPNTGLPSFTITDDDMRTGDPQDTIQRAASHLCASQHTHSPLARKRRTATSEVKDLTSCFSQTATKSRHANSKKTHLKSQAKQRQSVMFTIPNTPKVDSGGSLLHRGKICKDSCKSSTASSRALRSTVSAANIRSPRVSAVRKTSQNKPLRSSSVKKMSTING